MSLMSLYHLRLKLEQVGIHLIRFSTREVCPSSSALSDAFISAIEWVTQNRHVNYR